MYDDADTVDRGKPQNKGVEHSETGEGTGRETNVFQGKDSTCSSTPPEVAGARTENITVRLVLSVTRYDDKATRSERSTEDKMAAVREI